MLQKYGPQPTAEAEDDRDESNGEEGSGSGASDKSSPKDSKEVPPPPPIAPPELLKLKTGIVLVHQPPTQEFLRKLAKLGIQFEHIVHLTNNPEDIEEAEAAGATEFAFTDSEVVFEEDIQKSEMEPNEKEQEKEIDGALVLDLDVEPSTLPLLPV